MSYVYSRCHLYRTTPYIHHHTPLTVAATCAASPTTLPEKGSRFPKPYHAALKPNHMAHGTWHRTIVSQVSHLSVSTSAPPSSCPSRAGWTLPAPNIWPHLLSCPVGERITVRLHCFFRTRSSIDVMWEVLCCMKFWTWCGCGAFWVEVQDVCVGIGNALRCGMGWWGD